MIASASLLDSKNGPSGVVGAVAYPFGTMLSSATCGAGAPDFEYEPGSTTKRAAFAIVSSWLAAS